MSPELERRYRWLLRAYPARYRAEREAELLATLAAASAPGRRFPSVREAAGLLAGGIRARVSTAGGGTGAGVALDGLYLGALLLHLVEAGLLATHADPAEFLPPASDAVARLRLADQVDLAFLAVTVLVLLRGWLLPAVALVTARALVAASLVAGVDGYVITRFGLDLPRLAPLLYAVAVLALLAVASRRGRTGWRPRARSPWWLAVAAVTALASLSGRLLGMLLGPSGLGEAADQLSGAVLLLLGAMLVVSVLALAPLDPRPAIGAAVAFGALLLEVAALFAAVPVPRDGLTVLNLPDLFGPLALALAILASLVVGLVGARRQARL